MPSDNAADLPPNPAMAATPGGPSPGASLAPAGRLRWPALIAYAGPAVPLQMALIPLILFLPPYYSGLFGAEALAAVGAVFFIARLWDAVTDPVIGAVSDRTRLKFGRRRPFMLAGMVPMTILAWLLLQPPEGVGPLYLTVCLALFYVFWTMVQVPYIAWGAEISPDYAERSRIATVREGAGTVLGVVLALGTPFILSLLGVIDPGAEGGLDLEPILGVLAVALVVLFPVTILLACFTAPEAKASPKPIDWRETALVVRRNKPFLRLLAAYFLVQCGFAAFVSLSTFFIVAVLQLPGNLFLPLVFIQHIVGLVAAPFWLPLINRIGKHRAYCLVIGLLVLGLLALLLIPRESFGWALAAFFIVGLAVGAKFLLPPAIAADAVDYDTLKTGTAQAGAHMALLNLTNKVALAVPVGIVFPVLALAGFDPAPGAENSAAAIQALALLTTVPAMVVMGLGIAIMWRYPITAAKHGVIRTRLERLGLLSTEQESSVT